MGGKSFSCPQLPTTLPTLDELIGLNGLNEDNVAEYLLETSRRSEPSGHVFTLHAELEGKRYLAVLEKLLKGWTERGDQLVSLVDLFSTLNVSSLPVHHVTMDELPGRTGLIALQGKPFCSE